MHGIRSIAAMVAGYGFMASTVTASTILATALFLPGGLAAARAGSVPAPVPALFLVVNLATSLIGGGIRRMARGSHWSRRSISPRGGAGGLDRGVAVISALDRTPSPQPTWYPVAIGVIGVGGVLVGGWLRAAADAARGPVVA